jgi:hypothetical protein
MKTILLLFISVEVLAFQYQSPSFKYKPSFDLNYQTSGRTKNLKEVKAERSLGLCVNTKNGSFREIGNKNTYKKIKYAYKNCVGASKREVVEFDNRGSEKSKVYKYKQIP